MKTVSRETPDLTARSVRPDHAAAPIVVNDPVHVCGGMRYSAVLDVWKAHPGGARPFRVFLVLRKFNAIYAAKPGAAASDPALCAQAGFVRLSLHRVAESVCSAGELWAVCSCGSKSRKVLYPAGEYGLIILTE